MEKGHECLVEEAHLLSCVAFSGHTQTEFDIVNVLVACMPILGLIYASLVHLHHYKHVRQFGVFDTIVVLSKVVDALACSEVNHELLLVHGWI